MDSKCTHKKDSLHVFWIVYNFLKINVKSYWLYVWNKFGFEKNRGNRNFGFDLLASVRFGFFINRNRTEIRFPHIPTLTVPLCHHFNYIFFHVAGVWCHSNIAYRTFQKVQSVNSHRRFKKKMIVPVVDFMWPNINIAVTRIVRYPYCC